MDEAVQGESAPVDMDKLAAVYIKIRDKRATAKRESLTRKTKGSKSRCS
jgi:hypothetical protein